MVKIAVYAMNIESVLDNSVAAVLHNFPWERQQEILKYRFNPDRNRTVYGELLARWLLAKRTGTAINNIVFLRDHNGKPYWQVGKLSFNISHSGKWVVCSIGNVLNGVDVEIDQAVEMMIAKEYFLPKEYEYLLKVSEENRNCELLKLWTIKESYLKYTGEGISGGLDSVDCLALLQAKESIAAKNFILRDAAVVGVCTLREMLPQQLQEIAIGELHSVLG